MERVWRSIEIRYCPVVGHNVVVEPRDREENTEAAFVCQRAERCLNERGGCRHPAAAGALREGSRAE